MVTVRRRSGYRPQVEALEQRVLLFAPPLTDFMEGNASWAWQPFASDGAFSMTSDDTSHVQVGSQSVKLTTGSGFDAGIRHTVPFGFSWDLTAVDTLSFWTYGENLTPFGFQGNQPIVVLSGPGGSFRYTPQTQQMANGAWAQHRIPLAGDATWARTVLGSPSLANITTLEIHQDTWDYGFIVYYDGLQFSSRPPSTDLFEASRSSWSTFASDSAATSLTYEPANDWLKFTTASGFDTGIRYNVPATASWDLTEMQTLSFWTWGVNNNPNGFQGNQPVVVLSGPGGSFRYTPQTQQMANGAWRLQRIPLAGDADWVRTVLGNPSLANITTLEIHQDTWDSGFTVYYDELHFSADAPARPTVAITSPADGAAVSGTVSVTVAATSDRGFWRVELYVDDVHELTDSSAPYQFNWDARGLSGPHTLTVRAYERDTGNVANSATHTVTVTDPPEVVVAGIVGDALTIPEGLQKLYTLRLSTPPTADVVLTLLPDSELTVSPERLTFTPANWNVAQFVLVESLDDDVIQGPLSLRIRCTVASADNRYDQLDVPSVRVRVTDNDFPPFLPFLDVPTLPPPPAPGISARLGTIWVGKKKKWIIEVFAADTGEKKGQFLCPFQKPSFSAVEVGVADGNGDGSPDQVFVSGKRGKKAVSVVLTV